MRTTTQMLGEAQRKVLPKTEKKMSSPPIVGVFFLSNRGREIAGAVVVVVLAELEQRAAAQ